MFPRQHLLGLSVLVWLAFGCADPTEPEKPDDAGVVIDGGSSTTTDGGFEVRDGGTPSVGLRLKTSNLTPASGRATTTRYNLDARLRATTADEASTPAHTLRGGVVAGGASSSTTN